MVGKISIQAEAKIQELEMEIDSDFKLSLNAHIKRMKTIVSLTNIGRSIGAVLTRTSSVRRQVRWLPIECYGFRGFE